MITKIIHEDTPDYMVVAFDIGKTFRHDKYESYKGGRSETPEELKMQFPVAKEILTAMGIKYFEIEGYEADDIIGTFSKKVNELEDWMNENEIYAGINIDETDERFSDGGGHRHPL